MERNRQMAIILICNMHISFSPRVGWWVFAMTNKGLNPATLPRAGESPLCQCAVLESCHKYFCTTLRGDLSVHGCPLVFPCQHRPLRRMFPYSPGKFDPFHGRHCFACHLLCDCHGTYFVEFLPWANPSMRPMEGVTSGQIRVSERGCCMGYIVPGLGSKKEPRSQRGAKLTY